MNKVLLKPDTMVYPLPAVMISCGSAESGYNIITIAWTGIVNSEPPMTYVSVRRSRHSHGIIDREREFVINFCDGKLLTAADYCGVKSGRDVDKFKETGLTAIPGEQVKCPIIKEAPVSAECKVVNVLNYPSHDMFVAEIVRVHADEYLIDEKGKPDLSKAGLICYSNWDYYGLTEHPIGHYGRVFNK